MSLTCSSSSSDDAAPTAAETPGGGRLRGARLLRAISRRIGRRRAREAEQAEQAFRSSSTDSDSLSCSSGDDVPSRVADQHSRHGAGGCRSSSCSSLNQAAHSGSGSGSGGSSSSNSGSDSGSGGSRASAVTRAFQSLGLAGRSRSASSSPSAGGGNKKRGKAQPAPQKSILRPPVSYAYVRGISGLPTQRVPRSYHAHCAAFAPAAVCCRNA